MSTADELASGSKDEKGLKRVKEAASRKIQRHFESNRSAAFCGEVTLSFVFSAVFFAAYLCLWALCLLYRIYVRVSMLCTHILGYTCFVDI